MRSFGQIQELLVASPGYLKQYGRPQSPIELSTHITLSMNEDDSRQRWDLQDAKGQVQRVELQPRLSGHDFPLLQGLAIAGLGIALLPETLKSEERRVGKEGV